MKPARSMLNPLKRATRGLQGLAVENGHFDGFSGADLTGWCQAAGGGHVRVKLCFGDDVIGEALADQVRPDVGALGAGAADCGFVFSPATFEPALRSLVAAGDAPGVLRVLDAAARPLRGPQVNLKPSQVLDAAAIAFSVVRLKAAFTPSTSNAVH